MDRDDFTKKEAMFIFYQDPIPEGFYFVQDFNLLNGEESLKLVVKDAMIKGLND